jgi:ABC-type Fe3+/spermidine/putrescine transport system ATPase subunit
LDELLRRPNTEFVARFMRCENIYCGVVSPRANHLGQEGTSLACLSGGGIEVHVPGQHQGKIKFVVRPEDVLVLARRGHNPKGENEFAVNLVRWRDCGGYMRLELDGPLSMIAHVTHATFAALRAESGQSVNVALPLSSIHVLLPSSEAKGRQ